MSSGVSSAKPRRSAATAVQSVAPSFAEKLAFLHRRAFDHDHQPSPPPEVYAALLCKSDGFKVFGCRRFGLRLVPDFPLTTKREFLGGPIVPRMIGPSKSDPGRVGA